MSDMSAIRPAQHDGAASDRPCDADRVGLDIVLNVPGLGRTALTADAALETAYHLFEAALQAKKARDVPLSPKGSRAA